MKKHCILILLSICCSVSIMTAQRYETKKAHRLFEKRAYIEAASIYEGVNEKDSTLLKNLGDCYYFNTMMPEAAKWYATLLEENSETIDHHYYFRYAQALKGIKEYEKADQWLTKYNNIQNKQDSLSTLEYLARVDANIPYIYTPKNISSNTEYSDFGSAFYGDNQIVFASARNEDGSKRLYKWNDQPYLDIFVADINSNGSLDNVQLFSDELNSPTHEATAVFTKDKKTIYFSRTKEKKVKISGKRVANIELYKAELVDGKWTNLELLPFNGPSYSCGHPTLSNDEKKLYFVSDMPGSIGSLDIFEVSILEDGTYGEPKNLGPNVNTIERDWFPYMSEYNTLYFSSDGHLGLGGLDIFSSQLEQNVFGPVKNLGSSVNSNLDDFSIIINEKTDKGYFSSNREGTKDDDIFSFKRKKFIKPVYLVEGVVSDKKTGKPIPNALVTLLDENHNVIDDTIVKANGTYRFDLNPNKKYRIRGTKKLYNPDEDQFTTDQKGRIQHDIELELELYSDIEGNIVAKDGDTQVKLEKIYFEYNKWDILPASAATLDILVNIMNKYPNMIIEVGAHTDCRGSLDYNLELSHNRANSTVHYLVSKGISENRLKPIGYGELIPINECSEEGKCNEKGYEPNRRCEFKLLN